MQGHLSQCTTKPTKCHVRPAKTRISLGICPVWSESLLSARRNIRSLATHWVHSEVADQTGWLPRLIWVYLCAQVVLLVLSCAGSFIITLPLAQYDWDIGKVPIKPKPFALFLCCICCRMLKYLIEPPHVKRVLITWANSEGSGMQFRQSLWCLLPQ